MPMTIRVPDDIEQRYKKLATATGRSQSFYLNRALETALPKLEYEYGLLMDVEDYRAGRMDTHSLAEVGEMLGLDD